MEYREIVNRLKENGLEASEKVSAAGFTTFRTGGEADVLCTVRSGEELGKALALTEGLPRKLLGNGSNVLIGSGGFRGVIIRLAGDAPEIIVEGEELVAFAGARLSQCASCAARAGLTGMETLHGIPGSVGGAVYMNAGAYGGTVADVLKESLCYLNGESFWIPAEEHRFGYRESIYKEEPERVVAAARFQLKKGDRAEIEAKMRELSEKRRASQPLEFPSAGSVFKRPEGYFAGKLIQDAGLKGYRIGGAEVSPKHAGFIVNIGGAEAEDVLKLIRHIQKTVWEKDGVKLMCEVEMLGDFLYEEAYPWNS